MNPAILLLLVPFLFQGPRSSTKKWDTADRKPPPNLSGNPDGYNSEVFNNAFNIKLAFTFLGYDVDLLKKVPYGIPDIINPAIIKRFQKEYNAVSSWGIDGGKFKGIKIPSNMGYLIEDGNVGQNVLNALEYAMDWLKLYALAGYWQDVAYEATAKAYH